MTIFLLEGVRFGYKPKLNWMGGILWRISPFRSMSLESKMTPYHKNYSVQMRARLIIVFIAFCIVVNEAYS